MGVPSDERATVACEFAFESRGCNEAIGKRSIAEACARADQRLSLRMQPRYDHSYYFIQSFVPERIA